MPKKAKPHPARMTEQVYVNFELGIYRAVPLAADGAITPRELAEGLKLPLEHVNHALWQLRKHGWIWVTDGHARYSR